MVPSLRWLASNPLEASRTGRFYPVAAERQVWVLSRFSATLTLGSKVNMEIQERSLQEQTAHVGDLRLREGHGSEMSVGPHGMIYICVSDGRNTSRFC